MKIVAGKGKKKESEILGGPAEEELGEEGVREDTPQHNTTQHTGWVLGKGGLSHRSP